MLAAGLILGLFLMHGLTADHDASMPMSSAAMEMSAGSESHELTMEGSDLSNSDGTQASLAQVEATDSVSPVAIQLSAAMAHGMSMGGLCLALLGAGLTLRMLVARRLRRTQCPAVEPVAVNLARRAAAGNHPALTPSLHRLCISRT